MSELNDESFYNILGEEISREILAQQMIDFYGLKLGVGETKITDFNEGSEIRNLLESISVNHYTIMDEQNDLASIAFIDTAEGEWLDKHGAKPHINLPRIQGSESVGEVTFTIPSAATSDILIPEGTVIVSTDTGLEFATDYECTILIGETSVTTVASCLTVGEDGNIDSGSIDQIDDNYFSDTTVTVTNANAFTGGEDYEDDFIYRERLLNYIQRPDFGSVPYYQNLAKSLKEVHDILMVDETDYTKKILVNPILKTSTGYVNSVLAKVLELFTDPSNIILNHRFAVAAPVFDEVTFTITVNVSSTATTNTYWNHLRKYIDKGQAGTGYLYEFPGLGINEEMTYESVESALLLMPNVVSVSSIKVNGANLTTLSPGTNHAFKFAGVAVTQNVVS